MSPKKEHAEQLMQEHDANQCLVFTIEHDNSYSVWNNPPLVTKHERITSPNQTKQGCVNTVILYSVRRGIAFAHSMLDRRIGFYVEQSFDSDGYREKKVHEGETITHDMLGETHCAVTCGYGFCLKTEQGTEYNWHNPAEMHKNDEFFILVLKTPKKCLRTFFYFRIQALLCANYKPYQDKLAKPLEIEEWMHHRKNILHGGCLHERWLKAVVAREDWYPEGSLQPRHVVYDNPFGPYSNYTC